jgi:hypothetical protein
MLQLQQGSNGNNQQNFDPDQLLKEQQQWEQKQKQGTSGQPTSNQ